MLPGMVAVKKKRNMTACLIQWDLVTFLHTLFSYPHTILSSLSSSSSSS